MRDYFVKVDRYFERKNRSDLYKGYEALIKRTARRRSRHAGARRAVQEGLQALEALSAV